MKEPQLPKDEQELEARIRAAFDAAAEDLDPAIAGRLRAARRTALEAAKDPQATRGRVTPLFAGHGWYLGGAMAAAVLLAVLVAAPWQEMPGTDGGGPVLAHDDVAPDTMSPTELAVMDLEIMSEDASLELLEELEFYQWLLESGQDAG